MAVEVQLAGRANKKEANSKQECNTKSEHRDSNTEESEQEKRLKRKIQKIRQVRRTQKLPEISEHQGSMKRKKGEGKRIMKRADIAREWTTEKPQTSRGANRKVPLNVALLLIIWQYIVFVIGPVP